MKTVQQLSDTIKRVLGVPEGMDRDVGLTDVFNEITNNFSNREKERGIQINKGRES